MFIELQKCIHTRRGGAGSGKLSKYKEESEGGGPRDCGRLPPLALEVTTLVAALSAFIPFMLCFPLGTSLSLGGGSIGIGQSQDDNEMKRLLASSSTSIASVSRGEQSAAATRGLEGVDRSASEVSGMSQSIGSLSLEQGSQRVLGT